MRFFFKFLFFFVCSAIFGAVLWEHYVVGKIYYCVWGVPYIDFFFPDRWYHGPESGDMMQPGWSKVKLLVLWYSLLSSAGVISAVLASLGKRVGR